jgi:hypothetical protein
LLVKDAELLQAVLVHGKLNHVELPVSFSLLLFPRLDQLL